MNGDETPWGVTPLGPETRTVGEGAPRCAGFKHFEAPTEVFDPAHLREGSPTVPDDSLEGVTPVLAEPAAARLAFALLALEIKGPGQTGGLSPLRAAMTLPLLDAEMDGLEELAGVWRAFIHMVEAVQSDLEAAISRD